MAAEVPIASVHRDIAPGHEGHRQGAAADADQARKGADHIADRKCPEQPGQLPGGFGLFVEEHLGRHIVEEDDEKALEETGRHPSRQAGAEEGADKDPEDDLPHQRPVHRAPPVMRHKAGDGGEHDAGHRGAEGQVHGDLGGDMLQGEAENQHRHDHQPAADAQKPCQETGDGADRRVHQKN